MDNREHSLAKFEALKIFFEEMGYEPMAGHKNRIFLLAPDNDCGVERLLILTRGSSLEFMGVRYALRQEDIEEFAASCMIELLGADPRDWRKKSREYAALSFFPLAREGERGASPWGLALRDFSQTRIIAEVASIVSRNIEPAFGLVHTTRDHFDVLLSDTKEFPWWQSSGTVRLAQIIGLGAKLGMAEYRIRELLAPIHNQIARDLIGPRDVASFVAEVLVAARKLRPM